MFLKKLGITKRELEVLAVATGIFLLAVIYLITTMIIDTRTEYTQLEFLGHKFVASDAHVEMAIPGDEAVTLEITHENLHDLEKLSETINLAYTKWQEIQRHVIIFLYLLVFSIILIRKKETHFQGLVKGLFIGGGFILLLFIIQAILDLNTFFTIFGHDFAHMIY